MSQIVPSHRARWLAVLVLCVGQLMIILDATIVNVALPAIQRDLGFTQSGLGWVVNAYLIPFGGLLLLAGRLGDLIGRRRMFVLGLAVFTAASLLCGLADSRELLIAARFVQGVGGAMTSAVILGMVVTMFSTPKETARAIGFYSFVGAAGASIGVLGGGVLTQTLTWHWIFLVNLPIGIGTLFAARLVARDRGTGLAAGADILGAALVTSGLMLAIYTIVGSAERSTPATAALGTLSAALLAGFVLRQARARTPLLPLRVLRSRQVSAGNVVQALMVAAMFGFQIPVALYVQQVLGYSSLMTGVSFLPITAAIGVVALGLSARLITRFGPRAVTLTGLPLIGVGFALLARLPVHGSFVTDLLPSMLLLGLGVGLALPAVATLAMSGARPEDSGIASGLVNTTQQVGGAFGLAVLLTLATSRTDGLLAAGESAPAALTGGYHLAFGIGVGVVAVATVLAALLLRPAVVPVGTERVAEPVLVG
ncbi:MFS transporter [Longispora fulva]|uniref:EmrB/QacA subfamily drug resistance transporter n=1 Tax=Longispora fulva TaxID=619741 RepID=A0A8J7GTS7_9ACTN|nr:MFS transporter [Longispora fulva]MBG6137101.1 EmrB/QacA subfamily drug resistance transporter [Longispora fulva]GIG61545.1 MFS transporter [Longispora fulva]